MSIERRLESARKRLAALDAQWERTGLPKDPGALSGVKGYTRARQVKDIQRSTRIASESVRLGEEIRALERRLVNEQRDARIRAEAHRDVEALKPGDIIRYESHGRPRGVGRVLRVNKTTVTLEAAPGMDQPRIPYARIVETQHQGQKVTS